MAYDEKLATRIRAELTGHRGVAEKKMFGGLAFIFDGNVCCGIVGEDLMVRVGADDTDAALAKPHTRLFEMSGRSMTGWVIVDVGAVKTKRRLGPWVRRGVAFASSLPPKGS